MIIHCMYCMLCSQYVCVCAPTHRGYALTALAGIAEDMTGLECSLTSGLLAAGLETLLLCMLWLYSNSQTTQMGRNP